MNLIDLHVHSNASDGTLSPSELVDYAASKGLSAFALTDHDTVNGVEEAVARSKALLKDGIVIRVIPGVELSVQYKGKEVHMLGLFIDYKNDRLRRILEDVVKKRNGRNVKMTENLRRAGIDITIEGLAGSADDGIITRAHFARFLINHGYVKDMEEAFRKYLGEDGPYFVPREYLTPEQAVDEIRNAGGVPVLAHPLLYHFPEPELDRLAAGLADYGLAGIEAVYSSNKGGDERQMKELARKYKLLITGGSDFHGANKPDLDIGSGRGNLKIPESLIPPLEEWKAKNQ